MWDAFSGGFFELIHPSHLKALMSNWSWLEQNIQVQFMGDLSLSEKNKKTTQKYTLTKCQISFSSLTKKKKKK